MNKKHMYCFAILAFGFLMISNVSAQYGTTKFCPNTPAWNSNRSMVENAREMYENYAKGPDGCWWMKNVGFARYKEGYYTFNASGTERYHYNKRKKIWTDGRTRACVRNPFTGRWDTK